MGRIRNNNTPNYYEALLFVVYDVSAMFLWSLGLGSW